MITDESRALLVANGFQEVGDDETWVEVEVPYYGDQTKVRHASIIRVIDMGRACGCHGFFIVEALQTSLDYLLGHHESHLSSIMGDHDNMLAAWRAGRLAFRTQALVDMARYGIADPVGYGNSNWTVTEENIAGAIDVAIRLTNGQYMNLPEVVQSQPIEGSRGY